MSRRMGPGGRLRPSPQLHRPGTPVDPGRPAGFATPHAPDGDLSGMGNLGHGGRPAGLMGLPDYRDLPSTAASDTTSALLVGETFEDERLPSDAPGQRPGPGPGHGPGSAPGGRPFERRMPGETLRGSPPGADQGRPVPPHLERVIPACTTPQLRRFIKSRAYVPMHELRRRFGIEGADDDVTPIDLDSGRLFIGLPMPESQLLGDLMRGGEIGCELSRDPQTPVVVGVYAMRPVPRS